MLSSVGSFGPSLTLLPPGPEDARCVCAPPGADATSGGTVAGTARAAPATTTRTAAQSTKATGTKATATGTEATGTNATGTKATGTKATGTKATGTKATTRPAAPAGGYATSKATGSTSTAKKAGALAFLDDPRLSMEEKLLRLLAHLNARWNRELDAKMKEFRQGSSGASGAAGTGSSRSSSGGVGGLLKKAVKYAAVAMPQLGVSLAALKEPAVRGILRNVAGPALAAAATAAGQPALAPLALRYGPELVDAAASVASSVSEGDAGSAGTAGATKETAEGLGADRNDQLRLMEMQRILDQQKEMFSLVSNLLRTTHETRMAVIQNVR